MEVISKNNQKRILILGESFGDLNGATRVTSTKAITECLLWVMERKNFRKIVENITQKNFEQSNFIESILILVNIDHHKKHFYVLLFIKIDSKEDNSLLEKVILLIVYI